MNERARFWFILAGVAACIAVMVFLFGYESGPAPVPDPDMPSASAPPAAAPNPPAAPSGGAAQQPATVAGAAARPTAPPVRPASVPVGGGVIAGWVVYADGEPAPGAEVFARWAPANGTLSEVSAPERSTRADDQGYFAIDRLPDGAYMLRATDGTLTASLRTSLRFARRAETVLFLEHDGVIAGRVVDEAGAPIAGAAVTPAPVPAVQTLSTRTNPSLAAVTAEDGTFSISGLADEPHVLLAEAEGYAAAASDPVKPGAEVELVLGAGGSVLGQTVDSATNEPIGGVRVALFDADVLGNAVETVSGADGAFRFDQLRAAPYGVRVLDPHYILAKTLEEAVVEAGLETAIVVPVQTAGAVTGRVVDVKDRAPIAGAVVEMYRRAGRQYGDPRTYTAKPTDAGGVFAVPGLPDGDYDVLVLPTGVYSMARVTTLRVERGQAIGDVVVLMQEGMTVRGRVVTAEGEAAPGAVVSAEGGLLGVYRVTADENGGFEMNAIPPYGATILSAAWGPYRSETTGPVVFGRSGVAEVELRLGAEPSNDLIARHIESRNAAAAPPPPPQGDLSVAGVVVDRDGQPVEGARVNCSNFHSFVMSDARGRFVIDGIPAGRIAVQANHREIGVGNVAAEAGDMAVRVELLPFEIRGQVVDAETGAPVTRFDIGEHATPGPTATFVMGPMRTFVDPEGRFAMVVARDPGPEARLVARAEGYALTTAVGRRDEEMIVRLEKGTTITGRVVDSSGAGIAGAHVFEGAIPPADMPVTAYSVVSGADGSYTLPNVQERARGVAATKAGYADGYAPLAGRVEGVDITLGGGATLEVRVDTANWPGQATVDFSRPGSAFGISGGPIDENGVSITEGLPAGLNHVTVSLTDPDAPSTGIVGMSWFLHYSVELSEEQATAIDAAFPPLSAAVEGTVVRDGQPAANAMVALSYGSDDNTSDGIFRTTTDAAGQYRFDPVPAGFARIHIDGPAVAEVVITDGAGTRADIELSAPAAP